MRYVKMPCILKVSVPWLVLCWGVSVGLAAEDPELPLTPEATVPSEEKEPPVFYETNGKYFLGYRFVSSEDSLKAAEYIYPHSSATFGVDMLSCPLPYRYHVNAEFLSNYDFYTDAGFAYKDLILFRDILVGAHHNHDHYNYQYPGEPGAITYNDRNPADSYYTDFTSNLVSLRLKAPDFPTHAFASHRHVEQDGRIQERFLLGDRTAGSMVSASRDIDWKSNAVKLGANSHAGPLEVEYAYDVAEFVPGHNSILYDSYPASGSRPADTYPHGVVPETESSANTIKLHSSYTGGIVTAATLSNLSEKNNYSQTESTTWKGAFDCSWIPDPLAGLFFKYRHRNVTTDTPDTITVSGLNNNTLNYSVRQGLSYDKDVFSLSGRYKPLHMLSLFATYEFSYLDRNDVAEWVALPGQSSIHSTNFTAHFRPLDKIKVTASYDYKNYTDPSYNTSPDSSNQLRLSTTYTPLSWLSAYLEYLIALTERDSLHYINTSPSVLLETGEREGRRDQLLASLSTTLSPQVSLTAGWFYQQWKVRQDLAYGKWAAAGGGDLPYIDTAVPYTDESNSFSLSLQWLPREDITVVAGVTHTLIEGRTGYDDMVGGAPFSLDSFSAVKAEESLFSLEITRMLSKEWEVGLSNYVDIYNDRESGHLDGKVITTSFKIKRYF